MSVGAAVIDSAIEVSSLPLAGATDRVGASATAATVTARLWLVLAVLPPSVAVAVTVSVEIGIAVRGGRVWSGRRAAPAVKVHTPAPWSMPADSVAPLGTPLMAIAKRLRRVGQALT